MTAAAPLRAFVEELVAAGVRDAIVCPGSRSTPPALALRVHPALRVRVHVDERAAGFVALGLAKASRRPVVLLATSGTAVVNFAPAVAEAREGRTPLVVLTADRPPELRDRGSPQTLDQVHLYGRFAKWFTELPVPEDTPSAIAHARWVAARAVATAREAPAGPVQVEWGFREPLIPDGDLTPAPAGGTNRSVAPAHNPVVTGAPAPDPREIDAIARRVAAAQRPLIVVGPIDAPDLAPAVTGLAGAIGAPIVADALSNLRAGEHDRSRLVVRHDALLRTPFARERLAPDFVIRFGGTPTSKALLTFLADTAAEQLVVDAGGWNEPTLLPGTLVHADPAALARALTASPGRAGAPTADPAWLQAWLDADGAADAAVRATLATFDEPFEGAVFAELEGRLPPGTHLVVGNSMPVRDLEAFWVGGDVPVRALGNRAVNGIDGVVSTALGVATAGGSGPTLAVVGDLSFVHDLNALVFARIHGLDITVVVVDNDGGGIFSFLPQATADAPGAGLPKHYEELFGTPHGTDVLAVAAALGAETDDLEPGRIGDTIAASLARPGIRVLRLRTDRRRNVELHRAVSAAVADAVGRVAPAGGGGR